VGDGVRPLHRHDETVVRTVSPDEATVLLSRLGIEVVEERGDEMIALCPGHLDRIGREDGSPSWSFNAVSGLHHCFACGFKGGLLYLVAFQLDLFADSGAPEWEKAKQWLGTAHEVDLVALIARLEDAKSHAMPVTLVEMSEARLAVFDDVPERALKNRGLTQQAAQHHRVRWNDKNTSWITPIRDAVSGRLLGWQEKGEGHRYFRNRPAGVQKSLTLFGLEVWKSTTMIVVESPLDVVRLTSLGLDGGVSTFGASVSLAQVALMRQAETLVLAFDNDPAGRKASEFLLTQSRKQSFECRFFNYSFTRAKDIGEMTLAEIDTGLDTARHCVLGKAALA